MEVRVIALTGTILKSRYCILEKIAKGGEGSVYLARDMELGSLWAVKEIPLEHKREAKLLRLLSHPCMPRMIDYAEKKEYCYIVMEYINGHSLQWHLSQGKRFSAGEIIRMGMEAAGILQYLHERKPPVYYGDLKPENLMLDENGRLYLVDFGSVVFGYTQEQKVCLGTQGYAAPEQYEGRVGKTSDVYALGKTLLALMGNQKRRVFFQYPGLVGVLCRCCHVQEKRRYQDMKEVRAALAKLRKKREKGNSRWFLTGIAGAVVLLGGGGLLLRGKVQPDFWEALTEATDVYGKEEFLEGNEEERKEICEIVEKKLQKMLRSYREKEEQQKLLLALAGNSECAGETDRAEVYYEQLLLYEPDFAEGYGGYGLLLWNTGQEEKSRALWQEYQELGEEERSGNVKIWEGLINEKK